MSNGNLSDPEDANLPSAEEMSKQPSLAQRLRELTETALRRSEEEQARQEREALQQAQKIIADLETLALEQAQQGHSHLVVMDVTYNKNPQYADTDGFILDPSHLTGASRHVYEYCQKEGLRPQLISRWTALMENVHRIDFSLVISW
ncbi:MAG: hypothetical protein JW797_10350 [Bradymonadales bacterium]|nr:hypothetical protein [Bradymonadales bacterium]